MLTDPATRRATTVGLALGLGVVLLVTGKPTKAIDDDGDAIPDIEDNCSVVFNPPPFDCDTDQDGYGNICDGDFDQNLIVSPTDITGHLFPDFETGSDSGAGTDMDCNGSVNANDYELFFVPQFMMGIPGPSGLPCAGTVPCVP